MKAILEFSEPESCAVCPCFWRIEESLITGEPRGFCKAYNIDRLRTLRLSTEIANEFWDEMSPSYAGKRPPFCPLKIVPERKSDSE